MAPHLFADISSHGFGHFAQTAPVIAELRRRLPELRLTVRCGLVKRMLLTRIAEPFIHIREASDVGFIQRDALGIDRTATRLAYLEAHADWPRRVAEETAFLRRLAPDLVLANAAYLPLAGARAAGIPALGMSSLRWDALLAAILGREEWTAPVLAEMSAAYAEAPFLALTPAMPGLGREYTAGPSARLSSRQDALALRRRLGVAADERLLLATPGGFDLDLDADAWPEMPGLRYLLPEEWDCGHPAAIAYSATEFDFTALLRAADAVLTKPGYGTFTEAACNGTAVLYLRREQWPEQEPLIAWLDRHGRCLEIGREALAGGLAQGLERLLALPAPPPPLATGGAEAAMRALSLMALQPAGD